MFVDPQTVSIDGVEKTLPRVSVGDRKATYVDASGEYTMAVSHTNGKRSRSVIRLDVARTAADPINPATNRPYSMSTYLVVDTPPNGLGFTDAALADVVLALTDKVSEAGFLPKFLGQES